MRGPRAFVGRTFQGARRASRADRLAQERQRLSAICACTCACACAAAARRFDAKRAPWWPHLSEIRRALQQRQQLHVLASCESAEAARGVSGAGGRVTFASWVSSPTAEQGCGQRTAEAPARQPQRETLARRPLNSIIKFAREEGARAEPGRRRGEGACRISVAWVKDRAPPAGRPGACGAPGKWSDFRTVCLMRTSPERLRTMSSGFGPLGSLREGDSTASSMGGGWTDAMPASSFYDGGEGDATRKIWSITGRSELLAPRVTTVVPECGLPLRAGALPKTIHAARLSFSYSSL